MRKWICWIIAVMICIVPTIAVQPGITTLDYYSIIQQNPEGMNIEFPKNIYFEEGTDFKLEFHIFNSTYFNLNYSQVSCIIHIYNKDGEHLIEDTLDSDNNGIDLYYSLTNFTKRGIYPYIVQCNNSKEAGFVSTSFMITDDGNAPESNSGMMAIIVLIPLILGIISCFGAATLSLHHDFFKIVMFIFSFICIFSSLSIGIVAVNHFYTFVAMEDYLSGTLQWMVYFFIAIISYFMVYILFILFKALAAKHDEKVNY